MNETLKQHRNEIARLCEIHDVKEMYVFGSAATDTFGDGSDYDFLITFEDISVEKYTDNYFSLHKSLEELLGRIWGILSRDRGAPAPQIQGRRWAELERCDPGGGRRFVQTGQMVGGAGAPRSRGRETVCADIATAITNECHRMLQCAGH